MSHTPGPWTYYSGKLRPAFPVRIYEIHAPNGKEIVKWSGFDGLDLPKRQIAANVRVMATAPELLEACRVARRWLANCVPIVELDGPTPLPLIDAALAKAQGTQP